MRRSKVDRDLTCRELVELVTDYLDGALPAAERARFEAHAGRMRGLRSLRRADPHHDRAHAARPAALEERPEISALLTAFRDYRRRP